MANTDYWRDLTRFESHDYVGRWYRQRHARSLSASRTREIISCFTQGREYFFSAKQSATAVKPLLLYYGVLAFSRGLILLLDSRKTEASLKPSHGIEIVDWQGTLAGGLENMLEVSLRTTNGTFSELVRATANKQQMSWWNMPGLTEGIFHATYATPKFLTDQSVMTLDDLLSRDTRFLSLYRETTGRLEKTHLGEIVATPSGLEIYIFALGVSKSDIETRFGFPTGTVVQDRLNSRRKSLSSWLVNLPGTDLNALKPLIPATQYIGGDGMFIFEDFPNGDRLSELLRTFLIAYVLGMLVRYFPSKWMALLRNEKGDTAQPLLLAAMTTVESDWAKLISTALA